MSLSTLNLSILDSTSKFDDVLFEHNGLRHVLPLAVHLIFLAGQVCRGDHSKMFLLLEFICGTPPSCLE